MGNKFQQIFKLEDGHISKRASHSVRGFLKSIADHPYVKITIEPRKKTRSSNQNAFYWGVVIPPLLERFKDAGNNMDGDDVNEFLKAEVGKMTKHIKMPNGDFKPVIGSTKKLTTTQFEDYLEKIRAFAAETFNVIIPLPNEQLPEGETT